MKNKKTSGVEGQLLGFSEESVYITKAGLSNEFILKDLWRKRPQHCKSRNYQVCC